MKPSWLERLAIACVLLLPLLLFAAAFKSILRLIGRIVFALSGVMP